MILTNNNWEGVLSDIKLKKINNKVFKINQDFLDLDINIIIKKWNELDINKNYKLIINKKGLIIKLDSGIRYNKHFGFENEMILKWQNIEFKKTVVFEDTCIALYNCKFKESLIFQKSLNNKTLYLNNVKILGDIGSEYTEDGEYFVSLKLYLEKLYIRDSKIEYLDIYKGNISNIEIITSEINVLWIEHINVSKIDLLSVELNELSIGELETKDGIDVDISLNNDVNNISVNHLNNFKKFIIRSWINTDNNLPIINEFRLGSLFFDKNTNFRISGLNINKFYIHNVSLLGVVSQFNELNIKENFYINNVNFGETLFNGLYFSDDCSVFLKLAVFNNVIFNDTNLVSKDILNNYKRNYHKNYGYAYKSEISLLEKRDIYRHLKYVMDKNNNYIDGNIFFEKEMKVNAEICKESKNKIEYYYYLIQDYLSNYGNNWKKPVLWIFLFSILSNFINYIYIFFKNIILNSKVESLSIYEVILNQLNLLSPFYGLNLKYFELVKDDLLLYFGFIGYKLIYGVILYNIIIALKRNVKR